MSSVEEMEQAAKRWQVEEVKKDVKAANTKLDLLISKADNNVTHPQLEEAIKDVREYTNNQISAALSRVTPTVDALKKLSWIIIPVVIGLIADALLKSWSR